MIVQLAAQNELAESVANEVTSTVENTVDEAASEVKEEAATVVDNVAVSSTSIVDKIVGFLNQWKFAIVGLLGLLLLLLLRKIKASKTEEEEFELSESTFTVYPEDDKKGAVEAVAKKANADELLESVKADKTQIVEDIANKIEPETEESTVMSKLDMDALRDATHSEEVSAESAEITKESSFLTVYNDGDVIVNADEIDPIAESEVYIAYGREDQGEEVLLDGIKSYPDRNDIKIALLGLYAKSNKQEKFDGIYNSLIENGVENNAAEWKEVSKLKKTIDLKNGATGDAGEMDVTSEIKNENDIVAEEDLTRSEFVVDSEVNDLSEIDIKSETFEISEIDFGSDDTTPTADNGVEIDAINLDEDNELDLDMGDLGAGDSIVKANDVAQLGEEISIDIQNHSDAIDSNTIEVESFTMEIDDNPNDDIENDSMDDLERTIDAAIQEITQDEEELDLNIGDINFDSSEGEDLLSVGTEISQIDFTEEEMNSSEKSIDIDVDSQPTMPGETTDAIDIEAEISEISYDDEVSLTDVMELNVNDVDLNSIPQEQDLTPVVNNSASTLIKEVDYVEDDTVRNEVTVDLTETMEFEDDNAEAEVLSNVDLDLGNSDSGDGELPDGDSDPETQLDLAKVFLELDDVSGAVKILKDLVDSPVVGEEAKDLLSKHS